MIYIKNTETINKRCDKLRSLGFEPLDEDSKVKVYINCGKTHSVVVDFSATDENYFLQYALQEVYNIGNYEGKKELQSDLKKLLGIEGE